MDEDDDREIEVVEEVAAVEPVPWHNSDTAAAAFMFASSMADATAQHFRYLAMLAMGQSVHEWHEADREEFVDETISDIASLAETKESDG